MKNESWLDPILAFILWRHIEEKREHEKALERQRAEIRERWWESSQ